MLFGWSLERKWCRWWNVVIHSIVQLAVCIGEVFVHKSSEVESRVADWWPCKFPYDDLLLESEGEVRLVVPEELDPRSDNVWA